MIVNFVSSISGALEGQPALQGYEVRKVLRAGEDVKPGRFVCRKDSDVNFKLPTTMAEALACIGATILADTIALDSDGEYPSGKNIPLFACTPGLWMVTIDAATKGGQVYVNYAGANPKGSVSAAFVSGENVALPGARFGSTQATPGGLVQVEFDLPASAPTFDGTIKRLLSCVVTYDGSGVPTLVSAPTGVTIVDTATGVFQLVVAGASAVLPMGSPVLLRATPDTTDTPLHAFEVEAIAATSVTYSHRVQQIDATPNADAADPANGDKIYVGLLVTYA